MHGQNHVKPLLNVYVMDPYCQCLPPTIWTPHSHPNLMTDHPVS